MYAFFFIPQFLNKFDSLYSLDKKIEIYSPFGGARAFETRPELGLLWVEVTPGYYKGWKVKSNQSLIFIPKTALKAA